MARRTNNNFARYPNYSYLEKSTKALKLGYAHTVVCATLARDPRNPYKTVPLVSFQNYSQSVGSVRADDSGIYNSTSVVGLDQLFRPYTLDQNQGNIFAYASLTGNVVLLGSGLPYLPQYKLPSSIVTYSGNTAITSLSLHPFPYYSGVGGHDAEWLSTGSTYSGLHTRKKYDDSFYAARSVGLKAPLQLVGWGYNIAGNPVPHASGNDVQFQVQTGGLYTYSSGTAPSGIISGYNIIASGNRFADHAWEDSTKWVAGPLDVKWSPITGTWQANSMIKGKLDQTIPAVTGVADVSIWINGSDSGWKLRTRNWWSSSVTAGTKIMCLWDQCESYWFIGAADC